MVLSRSQNGDARTGRSGHEIVQDAEQRRGLKGRLHRLPVIGRIIDVQDRYGEIRGNNLAAAVTFQSFVALLPLLVVVIAVVGWISAESGTNVAGRIISEVGLTGDAAIAISDAVEAAEESRKTASVIGFVSLLWSGLGLVAALQYAFNQAWQVEERGIRDRAFGMLWLVGAALLFLGAAATTTVLRWLPGVLAPVGILVAVAVNIVLWLWTMKVLPNIRVSWRRLVPGAIFGAVGLEALKAVGAFYVPNAVTKSSQLYGSLGIVLAVLAWLFFFGRLIVYAAVLNVVLHERKAGTVRTVIEVPRQPGAEPTDGITRSGRLEKESLLR